MSRRAIQMVHDYFYDLVTDRVGGVFASLAKALLWVLSLVYGLCVIVLTKVYGLKPRRLGCMVISIGNITWGGTGKTPLVEAITVFLKAEGRIIAVLTRGYKGSASFPADEPYMLSRKLTGVPVIINSDRIKGGAEAIRIHGANTLVLDDGFQQWRIKKDLEIVTVDATNPFGNGCLIPRGILREPLSALRRADVFVLTNTDGSADISQLKERLAAINPAGLIVVARHAPAGFFVLGDPSKDCVVERIQAGQVALVSGIGNPASFRRVVESLKIRVGRTFDFPDHHRYSEADLAAIVRGVRGQGIETVITTEKDAVKLQPLAAWAPGLAICVLRVSLEITDHEEQFYRRLRSLYSA
jgi:tetraacyldisaccharide 4'-kinase